MLLIYNYYYKYIIIILGKEHAIASGNLKYRCRYISINVGNSSDETDKL